MLSYSIRDYEGIKILELSGNLTINTAEDFKSVVEQITDKESVIINMENVGLVTSAGLNSLIDVSFYAKAREKRMILLWPSSELVRMTEIMEVYNYLIFADSIEEGLTKIKFFT